MSKWMAKSPAGLAADSTERRNTFVLGYLVALIFAAIVCMHWPLLRLPFFWDEAGFYIPAAHDLARLGAVVPRTTLDTGHPPLPAAYLALWLELSGWKPVAARVAMLLLAAFALSNVFLLARRLAGKGVAVASTAATALYPIFFAQSSLAHADLPAAAFTLWGIRAVVEQRRWTAQVAFSLAVLSKETAVITPLALCVWELLGRRREAQEKRLQQSAVFLIPVIPLLGWLAWHRFLSGAFFGSTEFFRYNVTQALQPLRFVLALGLRLWSLLGAMNMLALTGAMAAAMGFPPVADQSGERRRIAVPVQLQFASILAAHVIAFSLLGGALLARYLLPCYPLVIIVAMSTLHRRVLRWEWPAAIIIIFFVLALFFDPPYRFAPEDNLTYSDFVRLHFQAARFLETQMRPTTVLTAWPAQDELTKPYLGYVSAPLRILPVADFSVDELIKARQKRGQYQVAYLFSTKYEAGSWFHSEVWEALNRRFFGYHRDLAPQAAADMLGGKVVFLEQKKAEWVAIIAIEPPAAAASARLRAELPSSR